MAGTVVIHVKAVPGARRDEVVGWLGEALKIRVAAPPEAGKANAAICALLAAELGIKPSAVRVERGAGTPHKVVAIEGIGQADVDARWPR